MPSALSARNSFLSFGLSLGVFLLASSASHGATASPVNLRLTSREAIILLSLLERAELGTDELPSYLAVQDPLEKATANQTAGASDNQVLHIKLPATAAHDLFIFLGRVVFRSSSAADLHELLQKVRKVLPADSPFRENPIGEQPVTFPMSVQECQLLQELLPDIEIRGTELTSFMALSSALAATQKNIKKNTQLKVQLSPESLAHLQIFSKRFALVGSQAKSLQEILNRLARIINS